MIRPQRQAAEGAFELPDGAHGDAIDHLLVELGVGLGGAEAVLGEQGGVVQVDRVVEDAAGGVDVNDFEVFASGSGPRTSTWRPIHAKGTEYRRPSKLTRQSRLTRRATTQSKSSCRSGTGCSSARSARCASAIDVPVIGQRRWAWTRALRASSAACRVGTSVHEATKRSANTLRWVRTMNPILRSRPPAHQHRPPAHELPPGADLGGGHPDRGEQVRASQVRQLLSSIVPR